MFRKLKISDSKVLKIKILVSNIRKVKFLNKKVKNSEISNDENSRNLQVKRKVD